MELQFQYQFLYSLLNHNIVAFHNVAQMEIN